MSKKNKARKQSMSCGAVAWRTNDGIIEVLLIKQFAHKDSWGIPKGHINKGETLEECAIREVREETGINVSLGLRLPDAKSFVKHEDKTVVSYLAKPVGDQTPSSGDPDCEVADAKWFSVDSLPTIHLYQRPLLEEAVRLIKSLAVDEAKLLDEATER